MHYLSHRWEISTFDSKETSASNSSYPPWIPPNDVNKFSRSLSRPRCVPEYWLFFTTHQRRLSPSIIGSSGQAFLLVSLVYGQSLRRRSVNSCFDGLIIWRQRRSESCRRWRMARGAHCFSRSLLPRQDSVCSSFVRVATRARENLDC